MDCAFCIEEFSVAGTFAVVCLMTGKSVTAYSSQAAEGNTRRIFCCRDIRCSLLNDRKVSNSL
jgi:hypothetical protein